MLPSNDMNEKLPVRLLYMTPLCLSANNPKQNTFAIEASSSSSPIRFGIVMSCITGGRGRWIGPAGLGGLGTWWLALPTGCTVVNFIGFGVVLLIPCRGRFMCPLTVAGMALRYLLMSFSLRLGHPSRKPCQTAFRSVDIFGLHNDWCANLTAFALVLMEWVKFATCELLLWASNGTAVYFFLFELALFWSTIFFLIGSVVRRLVGTASRTTIFCVLFLRTYFGRIEFLCNCTALRFLPTICINR